MVKKPAESWSKERRGGGLRIMQLRWSGLQIGGSRRPSRKLLVGGLALVPELELDPSIAEAFLLRCPDLELCPFQPYLRRLSEHWADFSPLRILRGLCHLLNDHALVLYDQLFQGSFGIELYNLRLLEISRASVQELYRRFFLDPIPRDGLPHCN